MEPFLRAPTLDVLLHSRQCACSPSLELVCRLKLSVDLTCPQALHSFCSGTCRQRAVEHDQFAEARDMKAHHALMMCNKLTHFIVDYRIFPGSPG